MTKRLFEADAYLQECEAKLLRITQEGGLVFDQTVFYPMGGGQPGDAGWVQWDDTRIEIASSVKGQDGEVVLLPAAPVTLPPVGAEVTQSLDWALRYRHMQLHTALHLLSVVLPYPVTGGNISAAKARLDFAIEGDIPPLEELEAALNALIERDLVVEELWVTQADLAARPELIKTMSVAPPKTADHIRLVWIGTGDDVIDLQPCGGTHVSRSSEIGRISLPKIQNKGAQNKRVTVSFA